jgi:hypothetical protein
MLKTWSLIWTDHTALKVIFHFLKNVFIDEKHKFWSQ